MEFDAVVHQKRSAFYLNWDKAPPAPGKLKLRIEMRADGDHVIAFDAAGQEYEVEGVLATSVEIPREVVDGAIVDKGPPFATIVIDRPLHEHVSAAPDQQIADRVERVERAVKEVESDVRHLYSGRAYVGAATPGGAPEPLVTPEEQATFDASRTAAFERLHGGTAKQEPGDHPGYTRIKVKVTIEVNGDARTRTGELGINAAPGVAPHLPEMIFKALPAALEAAIESVTDEVNPRVLALAPDA